MFDVLTTNLEMYLDVSADQLNGKINDDKIIFRFSEDKECDCCDIFCYL